MRIFSKCFWQRASTAVKAAAELAAKAAVELAGKAVDLAMSAVQWMVTVGAILAMLALVVQAVELATGWRVLPTLI